jgi:hypothetical protein
VLADDGHGVSTRNVWCWEFWFTYRDLELISCLLGYVIYFLS